MRNPRYQKQENSNNNCPKPSINKSNQIKIVAYLILATCIANLLIVSLPGIFENYTFWIDELYTVEFISGTWQDLILNHVLPDTNPPLYFATAKAWSWLTGTDEGWLRGLSLLFSIGTIFYLWADWKKQNSLRGLLTLLIVCTNPAFLYYSQEFRSYSLLLLLSTILTIETIKYLAKERVSEGTKNAPCSSTKILLLSVLLSLTHYFGYIFATAAIFTRTLWIPKRLARELWIFLWSSIWPILHLGLYGMLYKSQLSRIAIESQPWWMPLHTFSMTNLPLLNSGVRWVSYLSTVGLMLLCGYSLIIILRNKMHTQDALLTVDYWKYSTSLIITTLTLLLAINLGSPISTFRNYIIFITPTSVLIASGWEISFSRSSHNRL